MSLSQETIFNASAPDVELSILSLDLCISDAKRVLLVGLELGFYLVLKACVGIAGVVSTPGWN